MRHSAPIVASSRCENAAMRVARWDLKVGNSIEVYNVHHGDLLMVYTRRIKGVEFVRVKKER
jgi:hypothetical protein